MNKNNMDNIQNIINIVEGLKRDREFDKAIKEIENNLSRYNEDYRLYEELADIYLYQGKLEKAKKAVDFSLGLNKESPTGNYLKWFILLSKNKIEEAIIYLEYSNNIMPNNAEVLRNLGWAYCMKWDLTKWTVILKRALLLAPEDSLIMEDLAMALIQKWDIREWNEILKRIWKEGFPV